METVLQEVMLHLELKSPCPSSKGRYWLAGYFSSATGTSPLCVVLSGLHQESHPAAGIVQTDLCSGLWFMHLSMKNMYALWWIMSVNQKQHVPDRLGLLNNSLLSPFFLKTLVAN